MAVRIVESIGDYVDLCSELKDGILGTCKCYLHVYTTKMREYIQLEGEMYVF